MRTRTLDGQRGRNARTHVLDDAARGVGRRTAIPCNPHAPCGRFVSGARFRPARAQQPTGRARARRRTHSEHLRLRPRLEHSGRRPRAGPARPLQRVWAGRAGFGARRCRPLPRAPAWAQRGHARLCVANTCGYDVADAQVRYAFHTLQDGRIRPRPSSSSPRWRTHRRRWRGCRTSQSGGAR